MDTLARTPTIPPMAYLGVDPGLHGAWAVLCPAGRLVAAAPLPLSDGRVDAARLADQWRACPSVRLAAVELVGAMPGQGVTSMFTFGEVVGTILGVLGTLGHVPARPSPQRWQRALGCRLASNGPGSPANDPAAKAARRKAVKAQAGATAARILGPDAGRLVPAGCRVPHDGLVDAVCIAEWARLSEAAPWDA